MAGPAPSVSAALAALDRRRLAPELAMQRLYQLTRAALLVRLFGEFFPKELVAFGDAVISRPDVHRRVLARFLQLVNDRLFPLHYGGPAPGFFDAAWLDEELEDGLPLFIPYGCVDFDWWEMSLDDISGVAQAILEGLRAQTDTDLPDASQIDWPKLRGLAAARPEPLRWLPEAVEFVLHNTGNFFLDFTYEEIGYVNDEWKADTMRNAAEAWKLARQTLTRFNALDRCMRTKARREAVVGLIRSCLYDESPDEQPAAGRPLVEILEGCNEQEQNDITL